MHHLIRNILHAGMALLCAAGLLNAELPWFYFLEEPVHPRASAMGGAGTALCGGGFNVYNPASSALAELPFVGIEYGQQPDGLKKAMLETAWMFPSWFAGASFLMHSVDFQTSTFDGKLGTMSSGQEFGPAITAGYRYGPFASGHTVTLASERIADYSMRVMTYSTGAVYEIFPGALVAGASLMHYLRLDTLRRPLSKAPRAWYRSAIGLPRMARLGIAWSDTLAGEIPFTVALDGVYRDIDSRVMVPIGAEFQLLPSLAVRMGKPFYHQTEILHAGCGIRWLSMGFDFDYGLSRLVKGGPLEQKWLFGLTYSLTVPRTSEAEPKPLPVKRVEQKPPVPADTATSTAAKPVAQQRKQPKPDSANVLTQPDRSAAVIDSSALDQGMVQDSADQQVPFSPEVRDAVRDGSVAAQPQEPSAPALSPVRKPDSTKADQPSSETLQ
ncbi:MAG: hypothetical protein JW768_00405 [Chitinispirillaceae bacterium]|nr:hypothetical protein [Chitinispirillaceae bacterium]